MKTAYGLNIPQTLRDVCDPERVALLAYNMQLGILSQIKNQEQITGQVLKVLNAARDGFGFARNTTAAATTFDVFCWLEVTNFDVPLFDPSPNGLDYIDVWDF